MKRKQLPKLNTYFLIIVFFSGCVSSVKESLEWVPSNRKLVAEFVNLEEKAEAGDIEAQTRLGTKHALGFDVPKNYEIAATWYKRAALGRGAVAQYKLARLYQLGYGVPQSYSKAFEWHTKSANGG